MNAPAASLPECPQCGESIRQAERVGVSAFVKPCWHFVAAVIPQPAHVDESLQETLVADGGVWT